MKTLVGIGLVIAVTSMFALATSNAKFKISTKRADDTVAVQTEGDKTVFSVKSPFSISQADIKRVDDEWPEAVVLRLHLKGLESFRASNGKVTLDAAVSGYKGEPKVRLWKDGKEDAPLDEKSPFWMAIRILSSDGKPAKQLPLKDGYFEMTTAQGVFRGQSEVDHPELDRLLPRVMLRHEGQCFPFAGHSISPRSSSPSAPHSPVKGPTKNVD